jgi:protein tyrosine phosphatase (PTP) superfamily phosphohydrolase (DUF442 family)
MNGSSIVERLWITVLAASFALAVATSARPASPNPPPNLVQITDRLTTAGQPSAEWLRTLQAQGYEAVVYVAPPNAHDAVRDEQHIVAGQGLAFVNLPIDFARPTERDFELFRGVLRGLASRRVLVHCQINLRASSLVFLYRAIELGEDPARAYEALSRVWKPDATWHAFIASQLARHAIGFTPY